MAKKAAKNPGEPSGLDQLKNDLKTGQYGRLYLFHGEEHYLRDHYLEMLRKKLLDGPAEEFNFHRFTQENMELQALADAVEAMPMMAEHTLVQVDDYDLSRLSEGNRETLAGILSDIPDYCTVVFVFGTVAFKYDARWKKLKEALDRGVTVEFARQSPRELNSWIRKHFLAAGKDISDQLSEYLTFLTGGTMAALGAEIEKIAAYASGREVTRQDIDSVVTPVLDAEIFDITDAIANGDYETALRKLRTLIQMQQDPILLLAAIGSQMRRLLYARICMAAGKGDAALGEMLKAASGRASHPYVLQKTMTTARRVTDRFCQAAVKLCYEADCQLKGFSAGGQRGSAADGQRTLELLLLTLAQEARRD
ncbi:MAG: DNA polymerase III subunit delta [Candidatus Avoscillospira sp.]